MEDNLKGGLRERNKKQKLESIRQAAQALFIEKGYEATTTREVAERAGIGTGTLFLYARDKQDLLVLVYLEAIEEQIEQCFDGLNEDLPLIDRLVQIFTVFLRFYARDPDTSRFYVQALSFQKSLEGQRVEAFGQIVRFLKRLAGELEHAKLKGEVAADLDIMQAAQNFFGLYFQALNAWLGGIVDLEATINHTMRASFDLQIKGLQK